MRRPVVVAPIGVGALGVVVAVALLVAGFGDAPEESASRAGAAPLDAAPATSARPAAAPGAPVDALTEAIRVADDVTVSTGDAPTEARGAAPVAGPAPAPTAAPASTTEATPVPTPTAPPRPRGPGSEGVSVGTRVTLTVTDPDGTVVSRTESED